MTDSTASPARQLFRRLLSPCLLLTVSAGAISQAPVTHAKRRTKKASTSNATTTSTGKTAPTSTASQPAVTVTGTSGAFPLQGLTSPATVANSIFVMASSLPAGASVTYFIDSVAVGESASAPYPLGTIVNGAASGFDVSKVSPGAHSLYAQAKLADGQVISSDSITLNVVPSINSQFSDGLGPYPNQPSAQESEPASILTRTVTQAAVISAEGTSVRNAVTTMYRNWGIDLSLDSKNDQSPVLAAMQPANAHAPTAVRSTAPVSMWFSSDAPFYHAIPTQWPRVALPTGYFQTIQFSTAYHGDGIGFGEAIAKAADPMLPVVSQWYDVVSTHVTFAFHIPSNWTDRLPTQPAGDSHVIFIDPDSSTFVSSYKTHRDPDTGGPVALFASKPTPIDGLGTAGGSIAAGFAELPAMIQPGEATDPDHEIPHAIGGAISHVWAARVFPASSWDAGILTSTNSCTHTGLTNSGAVPYGAVIQLDPSLDLQSLKLSLPAKRVLRAMQVYGYYVMDFGCSDLDIYTAMDANDLEPFGGPWGNSNGKGVQNEIQNVLTSKALYVVAPLIKKQ